MDFIRRMNVYATHHRVMLYIVFILTLTLATQLLAWMFR